MKTSHAPEVLVAIAICLVGCQRSAEPPAREAPSVAHSARSLLLVTFDTTRHDYISPYGADPKITPNLSGLAATGTVFLEAYAQTNITNPSHLSIMTGLRARDHGIFDNVSRIPEGLDTLPEAFQKAGYETAAFPAATHVGEGFGWRGFDHLEPAGGELDATEVTNRALRWLEGRPSDRPFFAWIHYWDPHALYDPPDDLRAAFYDGDPEKGESRIADHKFFRSKDKNNSAIAEWLGEVRDPEYPRAMYAAEIHYADRELGRLLERLAQTESGRATAVFVLADHGESLGEHDILYDHPGLFEPQLRIPFLARVPGLPGGIRVEAPATQLDFVPTIADLFGVSLGQDPQGRSLAALLEGKTAPLNAAPTEVFVHEHAHSLQVVARRGTWKLLWSNVERDHLPTGPFLFDLSSDPDETTNLASAQSGIFKELRDEIEPWIERGVVRPPKKPAVAEKELERLRALGYIQ